MARNYPRSMDRRNRRDPLVDATCCCCGRPYQTRSPQARDFGLAVCGPCHHGCAGRDSCIPGGLGHDPALSMFYEVGAIFDA